MKEKHKNGCNILIITFTNLEKYVYSKNECLKQRRQPLPPSLPPGKSKVFSRRKSHLAAAVTLGRPKPITNKVCDWLVKQ